ncbi:MAG: CRTAC1 family protein, partial [Acidobacteria bacterium]|nr:CRTAC1 family protein [Acidobacteriota bacterium]
EDVTLRAGVGFSEDGLPEAGMGVDAGDYDGDGRMDLFVVNLSHETNTLYANVGEAGFLHRTDEAGLGEPSLLFLGFGTGFFDYDNDRDLDIYVNNGHLLENIHLYSDTVTYAQRKMLFENGGEGRFVDVADRMGEGFLRPNVGRGSATADWDDDGDLDLAAAHSGRRATLLRNDLANGNHWIGFRLVGRRANRDGIGARLVLEAGGRARHEEVRAGSSYLSQDDLRVHFGLGRRRRVDRLRVRWPGGPWEEWRDLEVDRYHRLVEGAGEVVVGDP